MKTTSTAILCAGLSKSYRIGESSPRYRTLRASLNGWMRKLLRTANSEAETRIWALQDISFEMNAGETLGIVGSNGAGKSTLLKVLSRITPPTRGHAEVHGRIGSLLEVGTGFHQELTGRDNIYLNGAILGMSRQEISSRFDEIVAFAGVEKFLDTPLKHYSSGMYMRLAFAVAAHLDTEILIVDEVLAVGDAEFQRKCLGKMEEVATQGRTILFVSHNLAAVQSICKRSLWIDHGRLMYDGESAEAVHRYLSAGHVTDSGSPGSFDLTVRHTVTPLHRVFRHLRIESHGRLTDTVLMGSNATITIDVEALTKIVDAAIQMRIVSEDGECRVYFCTDMMPPKRTNGPRQNRERLVVTIPRLTLTPGMYSIDLWCYERQSEIIDIVHNAGRLSVGEADVYGSGYRVRDGAFFFDGTWSLLPAEEDELANEHLLQTAIDA